MKLFTINKSNKTLYGDLTSSYERLGKFRFSILSEFKKLMFKLKI
jgi:hypothetical protein